MSQQEHHEETMLIGKAKGGDTNAFESLIRKYQKPIYFLCFRMTGAHQAADDLSQDVFIKAYFALSQFKEEMNFFSWIRKIAVNRAINYLKVWKREKSMGGDEMRISQNPDTSPQEMPEETYQRKQMVKTFKQALQELTAEQRAIFILKVYENQSYEQIASTLNIPQGTVMSRLSRARQKLKRAMAEYLHGGIR
jgi:RNA polymerase sigma-70 factor (ECF subfamily)